jgi:hypothetical protein
MKNGDVDPRPINRLNLAQRSNVPEASRLYRGRVRSNATLWLDPLGTPQ